jgi:hypothetical protein
MEKLLIASSSASSAVNNRDAERGHFQAPTKVSLRGLGYCAIFRQPEQLA